MEMRATMGGGVACKRAACGGGAVTWVPGGVAMTWRWQDLGEMAVVWQLRGVVK